MAWASSVFFCQAVVGTYLSDESGADLEAPLGQRIGDLIPMKISLEARADDACLDLLGALRWVVWPWAFGQEVGRRSVEDGVAAIVRGLARLEAEAGGKVVLGEVAAFPEEDHADLLLDHLFLGEGDGLPSLVSEHEGAVFDQNVDVETDLHGRPLPRGGIEASRALQICLRNLCQNQETSTVENGQTSSGGLMVINVDMVDS